MYLNSSEDEGDDEGETTGFRFFPVQTFSSFHVEQTDSVAVNIKFRVYISIIRVFFVIFESKNKAEKNLSVYFTENISVLLFQ